MEQLYPSDHTHSDTEEQTSIEDAFANELKDIQKPKKQKIFYPLTTSIDCVVFFRVRWANASSVPNEAKSLTPSVIPQVLPPIDPTQLVHTILLDLANTKRKKTRVTQRLIPISKTCQAGIEDITALTKEMTLDVFPAETTGKAEVSEGVESAKEEESPPTVS